MKQPIQLVGYNTHRLNPDDEYCFPEILMVQEFIKWGGDEYKGLDHLQGIINTPDKKMTERDVRVAMSAIQWFATPCGRGFYETYDRVLVKKLKTNYKDSRTAKIEKLTQDLLESDYNRFGNVDNPSEQDYVEFAELIKLRLAKKKEDIDNIPDIY